MKESTFCTILTLIVSAIAFIFYNGVEQALWLTAAFMVALVGTICRAIEKNGRGL